jgi:hypothetical protein
MPWHMHCRQNGYMALMTNWALHAEQATNGEQYAAALAITGQQNVFCNVGCSTKDSCNSQCRFLGFNSILQPDTDLKGIIL